LLLLLCDDHYNGPVIVIVIVSAPLALVLLDHKEEGQIRMVVAVVTSFDAPDTLHRARMMSHINLDDIHSSAC